MSSLTTPLLPPTHKPIDPAVTKLFKGATYLAERNKELAREHLLRIQLLLAQRPIK